MDDVEEAGEKTDRGCRGHAQMIDAWPCVSSYWIKARQCVRIQDGTPLRVLVDTTSLISTYTIPPPSWLHLGTLQDQVHPTDQNGTPDPLIRNMCCASFYHACGSRERDPCLVGPPAPSTKITSLVREVRLRQVRLFWPRCQKEGEGGSSPRLLFLGAAERSETAITLNSFRPPARGPLAEKRKGGGWVGKMESLWYICGTCMLSEICRPRTGLGSRLFFVCARRLET